MTLGTCQARWLILRVFLPIVCCSPGSQRLLSVERMLACSLEPCRSPVKGLLVQSRKPQEMPATPATSAQILGCFHSQQGSNGTKIDRRGPAGGWGSRHPTSTEKRAPASPGVQWKLPPPCEGLASSQALSAIIEGLFFFSF
jgi:hypothetical protein